MRRWKVAAAAVVVAGAALVLGTTMPAAATTHYTHATTLKHDCHVYANYPKQGIDPWGWTKARRTTAGKANHVGVRYTVNGYALIFDGARGAARNPHWGFMATSCLTDPNAYAGSTRLGDARGVGGNGKAKTVRLQPTPGARGATVHVGSVGTLRSGPKSFVTGNVRTGDTLRITTAHCGRHSTSAWIFGYAAKSGRWGYVQAGHLPACH